MRQLAYIFGMRVSEPSDSAGIGTLEMEQINNVANRWTMPIMGGIYVKF